MLDTPDELDNLHLQLHELQLEHRDLDHAIALIENAPPYDELHLRRLKKRKLQLRDRIQALEALLEPKEPA